MGALSGLRHEAAIPDLSTSSPELDSEARYAVRRLVEEVGRDVFPMHPWASEMDRWHELIFAILARILPAPQEQVRTVVERLANLGLLDVEAIAADQSAGGLVGRRTEAILAELPIDAEDVRRAITAIEDAARSLRSNFDGLIALYLRHYGELMLNELPEMFQFRSLTREEAGDAFTYWLQNVLNMPLSLRDKYVAEFCKDAGLSTRELITAADQLWLSVGVVDDLALARAGTTHVGEEGSPK